MTPGGEEEAEVKEGMRPHWEPWLNRPVVFQEPELPPGALGNWLGHIPFAFWMIDILRPRVFVELGTHTGASYSAFCQAVRNLNLSTACYAVDTWRGDPQAGFYTEEVFSTFAAYHEPRYAGFSRLIRSTFDDALRHFPPGSIDLIHLDGYHTYEGVRHDCDSWLPKLSDRGVMLFHDVNVHERDFGVGRVWEEVSKQYPSFSFLHSHGLGVLAVGKDVPEPIQWLVSVATDASPLVSDIRAFFSRLGAVVCETYAKQQLTLTIAARDGEIGRLAGEVTQLQAQVTEQQECVRELEAELAGQEVQTDHLQRTRRVLDQALRERQGRLGELEAGLAAQELHTATLDAVVRRMTVTRGWRALEQFWRLRDKTATALFFPLRALLPSAHRLARARKTHDEGPSVPAADQPDGRRMIVDSGLFDTGFYLAQYCEVGELGVDPLTDYLERGAARGRDPNPLFDTSFYLEQNADVAQAGVNALIHFVRAGAREGRDPHPWFDTSYYRERYPDVVESGINPLFHYQRWGAFEGRNPNAFFDSAFYLRQHPELSPAGVNPLEHFLERQRATDVSSAFSAEFPMWVHLFDTLSAIDRHRIRNLIRRLTYQPCVSVVVPVGKMPERWLRKTIESVRAQLYEKWELCIAADAAAEPNVRKALHEYQRADARIKVVFGDGAGSIVTASNAALELACGEFVAFVNEAGELAEHALYMVVEELNLDRTAALVYSDEDRVDDQGSRHSPGFKPDWNPELFVSHNYFGHLSVCRRDVVQQAGAFRRGTEGAQDYDLLLRVIESIRADQVRHIPWILYHGRGSSASRAGLDDAKTAALEAAGRAVGEHYERLKTPVVVNPVPRYRCGSRIAFPLPEPRPLVSFIIPTRDRVRLLRTCVDGILDRTDYQPVEIIIVDNGSEETESFEYFQSIRGDRRIRVIRNDAPFNFAALNNLGARSASGEVLGLLNNDIEVIEPGWLAEMVQYAIRPEIGAVGALLCYPDGTVQHAGVVLGLNGVAGHAERGARCDEYLSRSAVVRNVSAVTAACLVVRRTVYDELHGLDEDLAVAFNDVDFCLRILERGYRNVITPHARLIHHESVSRGRWEDTPEKVRRFSREIQHMKDRWGESLFTDPLFNPNLSLASETPRLAFPPRGKRPGLARSELRPQARIPSASTNGPADAGLLDVRLDPYADQSNLVRIGMAKETPRWANAKGTRPEGLSVIILSLDKPDLIIPLIRRMEPLFGEAKRHGWGFEVLIGDTGSTDRDVASFYRTLPPYARVIDGLKYQFAKCNNEVFFKHASYGTALFLNNDIIDEGGGAAFLQMRDHLQAHPETGVVGACLWFPDGRAQHLGIDFFRDGSLRGLCYHPGAHEVVDPGDLNAWWTTPAVTGACLMIHSALFERLGGFNEQYRAECQDVDLCLLARRLGYRTDIVNGGRVVHLENATRPKGHEDWGDRQLFVRRWSAFVEAVDE